MRHCFVHLWKKHSAIGLSGACHCFALSVLPLSAFSESSALLVGIHDQAWLDRTVSGYQPCFLVSNMIKTGLAKNLFKPSMCLRDERCA